MVFNYHDKETGTTFYFRAFDNRPLNSLRDFISTRLTEEENAVNCDAKGKGKTSSSVRYKMQRGQSVFSYTIF